MPGIVLFGRSWLFGSDDLVHTSLLQGLIRTIGLLSSIIFFVMADDSTYVLPYPFKTIFYISIFINVLQIILLIVMAYKSGTGGIFDIKRRIFVSMAFYIHFFLTSFEFIIYITFNVMERILHTCLSHTCLLLSVLSLIGIGLISILAVFFFIHYDSTGRSWRNVDTFWLMPMDCSDSVDTHVFYLRRRIFNLWHRRVRCMTSCCRINYFTSTDASKHVDDNVLHMVAYLLGHYFMTNLIPTDILAGLILIRWQTHQWVGGSRVPISLILQETEPSFTKASSRDPIHPATPFDRLAEEWLSIHRIWRYSKFAVAIYGQLYYTYSTNLSPQATFALCRQLRCSQCCGTKRRRHAMTDYTDVESMLPGADERETDCCLFSDANCHLAAFLELTKENPSNIIYASFTNKVCLSPFTLVTNEDTASIILSVRGTLSVEDLIVDLLAHGLPLREEEKPYAEANFIVHMGILTSARNLRDCLMREGLIEKARERRPSYPLVVCGHSLGAGIASILAFLLRPHYPEVKAYVFSPPLGLMNRAMADYCKQFTCAVIYGHDLIPRLSLLTLNDLKYRLLDALVACRVPKFRILGRGIGLTGLRCILPCLSLPSIGSDSRHLDRALQQRLLYPHYPQANRTNLQDADSFVTPPNALSDLPESTRVRFLPAPRSLMRWLNGDSLLGPKTNQFGTFVPTSLTPRLADGQTVTSRLLPVFSMDEDATFSGVVLHIVDVDYSTSLDGSASTTFDRLSDPNCPCAVWSDASSFRTILVHPRMMRDHLPNVSNSALDRLYSAVLAAESESRPVGTADLSPARETGSNRFWPLRQFK